MMKMLMQSCAELILTESRKKVLVLMNLDPPSGIDSD
uniref:Uncharacterized protein n=1 Tax=Utricularia reniformis TaxID=192314 RepID=A0A1Y0B3L4_9LAMI|nr:hypothetical protein AEK19_MT0867 [Utricularia reniformis]YP_009382268.1 hypothetical protein AEK19_MT1842 [Utricularia reniformis]ART31099.1 hypothetical protein AEK19_MT0867 [Utricularia reniformis]ART32012.1 hypothetical protein AEK19_MT1842 [Utricularia reniformis]